MNWESYLLMRNELALTIVLVIGLLAEIFVSDQKKQSVIDWMIILFMGVTIIGFLPPFTGEIFGGMFRNSDLTNLMKNVLNIGTLIILFQSVAWLKSKEIEKE
jgi:NADH:ubiquinone oxidoreductase subunit 2 (subunit N)